MACEYCGNNLPLNAQICPICGTALSIRNSPQYSGRSSTLSFNSINASTTTQKTKVSLPDDYTSPLAYIQIQFPAHIQHIQQPETPATEIYTATLSSVSSEPVVTPLMPLISTEQTRRDTEALLIEFLFSLFGIFGIGWLRAGRIGRGILLFVFSITIYWPIMLLGTIFTTGVGLILLGPLAVASISLNFFLLSKSLQHQEEHILDGQLAEKDYKPPMPPPLV